MIRKMGIFYDLALGGGEHDDLDISIMIREGILYDLALVMCNETLFPVAKMQVDIMMLMRMRIWILMIMMMRFYMMMMMTEMTMMMMM